MTPETTVRPEPIFAAALGFMSAKHFFVANEIGLFSALAHCSCSLDQLAARTNVPKWTALIIADAMVAPGFLEEQNGQYRNGAAASAFLAETGPADFRPMLRFYDHISYPKWIRLEESVRAGKGMAGPFEFKNEQEVEIFSKGVEAATAGTAQLLPDAHYFGRYRRVLDLGGGTGSFLLPLLNRYPSLKSTLFELPQVAEIAQKSLSGNTLSTRVQVVEGDMFATPIPGGHDAAIIANVIHTLSVEHTVGMFANLRKSVTAGARLLLVDLFTDPSHTQPAMAALVAGEFLVLTGEGDVYCQQEIEEWLGETGWRVLEYKPLNGPTSLMVAEAN